MYTQDIVISPDIFEKISNSFSGKDNDDLDFKSYKENLELKCLVLDDDKNINSSLILDEIKKIKNDSSDFGKLKIQSLLDIFILNGRVKYLPTNDHKSFTKNKTLNTLFALGHKTDSKIINSENQALKIKCSQIKELEEIEILNFEESITPPNGSKIFCNKREIEFLRGEKLRFDILLKHYFYDTKTLTITDQYLRRRNRGFRNMIRIMELCPNLKAIAILTNSYPNNPKNNFDMSIDDIRDEVCLKFPKLVVKVESTSEHRRSIETDDFIIKIDPGLDFVDENYITEKKGDIFIKRK